MSWAPAGDLPLGGLPASGWGEDEFPREPDVPARQAFSRRPSDLVYTLGVWAAGRAPGVSDRPEPRRPAAVNRRGRGAALAVMGLSVTPATQALVRFPPLWVSTDVDEENRAERARTARKPQRVRDAVRARQTGNTARAGAFRLLGLSVRLGAVVRHGQPAAGAASRLEWAQPTAGRPACSRPTQARGDRLAHVKFRPLSGVQRTEGSKEPLGKGSLPEPGRAVARERAQGPAEDRRAGAGGRGRGDRRAAGARRRGPHSSLGGSPHAESVTGGTCSSRDKRLCRSGYAMVNAGSFLFRRRDRNPPCAGGQRAGRWDPSMTDSEHQTGQRFPMTLGGLFALVLQMRKPRLREAPRPCQGHMASGSGSSLPLSTLLRPCDNEYDASPAAGEPARRRGGGKGRMLNRRGRLSGAHEAGPSGRDSRSRQATDRASVPSG